MYTGISQPFHTLGSLMSRDKHKRETISNIRMALSITQVWSLQHGHCRSLTGQQIKLTIHSLHGSL